MNNFQKIRCTTFIFLFSTMVSLLISDSLFAQNGGLVNYTITLKTANEKNAGTDCWHQMAIYGPDNHIGYFPLENQGVSEESAETVSQDRNGLDQFTVRMKDIGKIVAIGVKLQSCPIGPNDWKLDYIEIRKEVSNEKGEDYYLFEHYDWTIKNMFPIGNALLLHPTSKTEVAQNEYALDEKGSFSENKFVYRVDFYDNRTELHQETGTYTVSWGSSDHVAISNTYVDTKGLETTLGYESPELMIGKFSTEVKGSWEVEVAKSRETTKTSFTEASKEYQFTAPAQSITFAKWTFNVPYKYTTYKDKLGNKRIVRAVQGTVPAPSSASGLLQLPDRDSYGRPIPYELEKLQEDYIDHMDQAGRQEFSRILPRLIADGWVTNGEISTSKPEGKITPPYANETVKMQATDGRLLSPMYDSEMRENFSWRMLKTQPTSFLTKLMTEGNDLTQQWLIQDVGNGQYVIRNKYSSNEVLTPWYSIQTMKVKGDEPVFAHPYKDANYQKWMIEKNGNTYVVRNVANNKCLNGNGTTLSTNNNCSGWNIKIIE